MGSSTSSLHYDVAIVGGGPAGLSAALVLGRMRRRVALFDTDDAANAVSHGVGGLLTRDGTPPAELRAIAAEELERYPSVSRSGEEVVGAAATDDGFEVQTRAERIHAKKLLLAHGLTYDRPEIEGVEALWGERAFHCPYCHGWEVRDRRVVVIAINPKAVTQALLLRSLTDHVTLVVGTGDEPSGDDRELLAKGGVEVVDSRVARVEEHRDGVAVLLDEREPLLCDAIFIQPSHLLACDLAKQLGAEQADDGTIVAGSGGKTDVPGLHVAGDAGVPPQAVSVAIGEGAAAAFAINLALAYEDLGAEP